MGRVDIPADMAAGLAMGCNLIARDGTDEEIRHTAALTAFYFENHTGVTSYKNFTILYEQRLKPCVAHYADFGSPEAVEMFRNLVERFADHVQAHAWAFLF